MRYLFFLSILFFIASTQCEGITVSSSQPEYAGQKLEFYYHADPVTLKQTLAFSLQFDNNGKASANVDLTKTKCFYCNFGIYRGTVFLEPEKDIILKMPPLREKSFADRKNPYFEPIPFWFTTEENNDLNNKISSFTLQLNKFTDKYFDQLYFKKSKAIYDSLINQLNKNFSENEPKTFKTYKTLTLKMLQADVFRLKPESYSAEFSGIASGNWQNPAFEDLFEKIFNNQLSFAAKAVKGDDLRKAVNDSDLKYLEKWVETRFQTTGEMTQLVLLKLLYDGYYSGDFSKNAIESMVRSFAGKNSNAPVIRKTAENIYAKFTFLKTGTRAPEICLKDLKDETICTSKNNHKYKYLVFADIEMIVCREHLKYLASINEKYQKYLEIYVVLNNKDKSEIEKFITENPVPGYVLMDKTEEYTRKYNIKSFPQCFLLDENYRIILETVKPPLDGFEHQFGTFLRNELFKKQRDQSQ